MLKIFLLSKFLFVAGKVMFCLWKRLFAGTVPAYKNLFAGTVPANKNLFAGTCSGKLELICRNLSSRLTLYFDPRNGLC